MLQPSYEVKERVWLDQWTNWQILALNIYFYQSWNDQSKANPHSRVWKANSPHPLLGPKIPTTPQFLWSHPDTSIKKSHPYQVLILAADQCIEDQGRARVLLRAMKKGVNKIKILRRNLARNPSKLSNDRLCWNIRPTLIRSNYLCNYTNIWDRDKPIFLSRKTVLIWSSWAIKWGLI